MITKETIHKALLETLEENQLVTQEYTDKVNYYLSLLQTLDGIYPIESIKLRIPFANKKISLIQFQPNLQMDYDEVIGQIEFYLFVEHLNKGHLESTSIHQSPKGSDLLIITEQS